MKATIAYLPGDGIGPEAGDAAMDILRAVGSRFGHEFDIREGLVGGAAIDAAGDPLPEITRAACKGADAVFLGAVGGPKWDGASGPRPEAGLLALRKLLGLFANLRPVRPCLRAAAASPLKPEILAGVDLIIVRELTGGIYYGDKIREAGRATDVCTYSQEEIVRVVRRAAQLAKDRRRKITSIDKANVLETSRLWREVTSQTVADEFPELEVEHLLVDAAAMHLLSRPADFDVIVTENMFGDILSDEASMLVGSIGLLPSASLGDGRRGLYEPIHGSAPDIAGQGLANPMAAILSSALMLRHSFGLEDEAGCVETAVDKCLEEGTVTTDLGGNSNTTEVTETVRRHISRA
jgi:3-isopropylmalate dehydrogenase